MNDLRDLYQDVILDHGRRPRNHRVLDPPARKLEGFNPLCGDRIQMYVLLDEDGVVKDVSFQGTGCAVSQASASILTEICRGKTREQIEALFARFHDLVTGEDGSGGAEAKASRGGGEDGGGAGGGGAGGGAAKAGGPPTGGGADPGLGKIAVFAGIREFPMRVKCATLSWHTLRAILDGKHEAVSTE